MTDTDTHINVRLFIARVITNRPKVRQCCYDSLCANVYMCVRCSNHMLYTGYQY